LAAKRGEATSLSLAWDPVEHTGEPVRCGQCRGLAYEVGLHRSGMAACARCVDVHARPLGRA
jgi:hypothetical protein